MSQHPKLSTQNSAPETQHPKLKIPALPHCVHSYTSVKKIPYLIGRVCRDVSVKTAGSGIRSFRGGFGKVVTLKKK
jgi:hypothetical protein